MALDLSLHEWADIATIAMAVVSVVALGAVGLQLRAQRLSQREATAQQFYTEFLKQALAHPEFIQPEPNRFDFDKLTFDSSREKFWEYDLYIELMLSAFELIFDMTASGIGWSKSWLGTMRSHLTDYAVYLSSIYNQRYDENMDKPFLAFVRSAIREGIERQVASNAAREPMAESGR